MPVYPMGNRVTSPITHSVPQIIAPNCLTAVDGTRDLEVTFRFTFLFEFKPCLHHRNKISTNVDWSNVLAPTFQTIAYYMSLNSAEILNNSVCLKALSTNILKPDCNYCFVQYTCHYLELLNPVPNLLGTNWCKSN